MISPSRQVSNNGISNLRQLTMPTSGVALPSTPIFTFPTNVGYVRPVLSPNSQSSQMLPRNPTTQALPTAQVLVQPRTVVSSQQTPNSPEQSPIQGKRVPSNELVPIQSSGERIFMFTDHSGQIHTFTQSELNDLNDLTAQLAAPYGQVSTQGIEQSSFDQIQESELPSSPPLGNSYPTPESENLGSPEIANTQTVQSVQTTPTMPAQQFRPLTFSTPSFDNVLSSLAQGTEIFPEQSTENEPFTVEDLPFAFDQRYMSPANISEISEPLYPVQEEGDDTENPQQNVVQPRTTPAFVRDQKTSSKGSAIIARFQQKDNNVKRMRPSSFDSIRTFLTMSTTRPGSVSSNQGGSIPIPKGNNYVVPIGNLPSTTSPPPATTTTTTTVATVATVAAPVTPTEVEETKPAVSPTEEQPKSTKKGKSVKKIKLEKSEQEKKEYNRQKASKSMKGLANDIIETGELLKRNREILKTVNIELPEEGEGSRPMQKPAIVRAAKNALGKMLPSFAVIRGLRVEKDQLEADIMQLNRQRDNALLTIQQLQLQMETLRLEVEGLSNEKSHLITEVNGFLLRRESLFNEVGVAQQHLAGLQGVTQQLNPLPMKPVSGIKPRPGKSMLGNEVLPDT